MRDLEIDWDDLVDAFENDDDDVVFFFDRTTGEVFFVPADYEDEDFWEEMANSEENYLQIPGFDYEQERAVVHEFIKGVENHDLKQMLERGFTGKRPYGRLDEILSFYPEEAEKLAILKDEATTDRIRRWLEEHNLYVADDRF